MKACVYTLGCKVNDVESGSLIRGLEALGYEVTRELSFADVYIVNTCAVTAEAERKSRQTVSKALKCNPAARVFVCGCASEKSPEAFWQKGSVYFVSGAKNKGKLLRLFETDFDEAQRRTLMENGLGDCSQYEEMPRPECLKTRNFVKIQDGCNRFCSYCVIPYLRGRSRSRSIESAAEEILQSDAYETVITGIDVSDYRADGKDLADLLLAVKNADTRIRLGSIEVSLVTERFLEAAKQVKNFAPQFHLSLQSGSNAVLKSMNRHYTREEYLQRCEMIYQTFENAAITTDIIVGFPTETEEDFLSSLSIVSEAGFSQIHAFPYSPREGTNAWKKYKEIPFAVKKERLVRLLRAGEEQKRKYMQGYVGKTLCLVPEQFDGEYTEGYSENYIRVYVRGDIGKQPTRVRVEGLLKDGVLAAVE